MDQNQSSEKTKENAIPISAFAFNLAVFIQAELDRKQNREKELEAKLLYYSYKLKEVNDPQLEAFNTYFGIKQAIPDDSNKT